MRAKLQKKITIRMIIFAVVLIASFALVQVQNQLRIITIFNTLRAKLTAQMLSGTLQKTVCEIPPEGDINKSIDSAINSLYNSGLLETAMVYSPDGIIKVSSQTLAVGKIADQNEMARLKAAFESSAAKKQFSSYVNRDSRILQLYIPIPLGETTPYVARLDMSLGNMVEAMKQVYLPVILIAFVVVAATIFFGMEISKGIVGPISLLNDATKEVAGGDLNLKIHMDTDDELQELAETFNTMALELKKMKAKAENANPLTKLPGNIVIQEEVEKRIKGNKKFMVIYADLDDFKVYNDKYGIKKGDEAILLAASILKESVAKNGNPDDFVGHEGGDDFMLLTTPDKAKDVGNYIITELGKRAGTLYNKEDFTRGYILSTPRYGTEQIKFPLMTISLAGVTNEVRPIISYIEVTNIAAEVKAKAKAVEGSCFIIDRRKTPWPPDVAR